MSIVRYTNKQTSVIRGGSKTENLEASFLFSQKHIYICLAKDIFNSFRNFSSKWVFLTKGNASIHSSGTYFKGISSYHCARRNWLLISMSQGSVKYVRHNYVMN